MEESKAKDNYSFGYIFILENDSLLSKLLNSSDTTDKPDSKLKDFEVVWNLMLLADLYYALDAISDSKQKFPISFYDETHRHFISLVLEVYCRCQLRIDLLRGNLKKADDIFSYFHNNLNNVGYYKRQKEVFDNLRLRTPNINDLTCAEVYKKRKDVKRVKDWASFKEITDEVAVLKSKVKKIFTEYIKQNKIAKAIKPDTKGLTKDEKQQRRMFEKLFKSI